MNKEQKKKLVHELLRSLELPEKLYQKAVERYQSLAEWFERPESKIRQYNPEIYPQGSFRLGTVNPPLNSREDYDLDLVCRIDRTKLDITQSKLKRLVGEEVKSYAKAKGIQTRPQDGKRCWTLLYKDDIGFHMDILPSIPESEEVIGYLHNRKGVRQHYTEHGLAITDKECGAAYENISLDWPTSNPKGYAVWFEDQMNRGGVLSRARQKLVEERIYNRAEEVPANRVKTPLQQAVQILKRHRDNTHKGSSDDKPASIIIATLAARAYNGESDLESALWSIVAGMRAHIRDQKPRVENPVNPEEDFTDRWDNNRTREQGFFNWLDQVENDFRTLGAIDNKAILNRMMEQRFKHSIPENVLKKIIPVAVPLISTPVAAGTPPWSYRQNND